MWGKTYPIYLYFSVIIIGNSPKYIQSITTMNKLILFASALAVLGLTSDRTNIPPQKFISFNNTKTAGRILILRMSRRRF